MTPAPMVDRSTTTPAQFRARRQNWDRLRVLGAAGTLRNIRDFTAWPEDAADFEVAKAALERILARHHAKMLSRFLRETSSEDEP